MSALNVPLLIGVCETGGAVDDDVVAVGVELVVALVVLVLELGALRRELSLQPNRTAQASTMPAVHVPFVAIFPPSRQTIPQAMDPWCGRRPPADNVPSALEKGVDRGRCVEIRHPVAAQSWVASQNRSPYDRGMLYERLRNLSVEIEDYVLESLELEVVAGWTRRTTVVRVRGGGLDGVGEDVTYQEPDALAFQERGPVFDLAGTTTLEAFSHRLDRCDLFQTPAQDPKAPLFRRWAFESAALDLALQQAGRSLADVLGRTPAPVRFVLSLGLGDPPSFAPIALRQAKYPLLGYKLDPNPAWDDALIAQLAATGAVTTVDLKGQYKGAFAGTPADPDMYRRVAAGFPEAWIEDPKRTPETEEILGEHQARITWDAPICSLSDIAQLPYAPEALNIKPSRFGRLSELFRAYAYCEARGIAMYGGGQFELGPGRGQIQYLASLFHADAPNDVAPGGFNAADLADDLPGEPLQPTIAATGFRWNA